MKQSKLEHLSLLASTAIENIDWNFVINCFGKDPKKLKYFKEVILDVEPPQVQYIETDATIESLAEDLIQLILYVLTNKIKHFANSYWTIFFTDFSASNVPTLEIIFSPVKCIVEDRTEMLKRPKYGDKLITLYKRRENNPAEFHARLFKTLDSNLLKNLLKKTENDQDYETCSIIKRRIDEINTLK